VRRIAIALLSLAAVAAVVATTASGDGDGGGDYLVRAYFDNGGFVVHGEDVRIAGATVGSVEDVDVSQPGEAVTQDGSEDPGKAVLVLRIEDPGFQDFLSDASCLIRPQSLLGEKYVECDPTQPRAPGSEPPPELEQVPDGDIGEGQYRLPLENNGKAVDLDLINNITREPEAERLRLIINDLGAGLSARGEDLAEVIRRADPALQETDKVLAMLADQNKGLAKLASDSDAILGPLAREREHVAGFIRNATTAGEAAAERRDDISRGLRDFPPALDEIQSTMVQLRKFAVQAQPVAVNLREAAPDLAGATRALAPFSRAGTIALTSLGNAAEASGPDLAASDSVLRQLRKLGVAGTPTAKDLKKLFGTLRKTGGIDNLMGLILNTSNVTNGFDDFGHYLRTQIQITNCVEYVTAPKSGCEGNFLAPSTSAEPGAAPSPESFGAEPSGGGGEKGFDATAKEPDNAKADAQGQANVDLFEFLMGDGK
jgi:phospholipid/cholesterol/gamma-HCH transport system substrate-binding protein